MAKSARPIPDHYHAVMPYLTVHGAAQLIAFLTQVFDGQQTERVARPDGTIVHADVRIGDAAVMLADATGAFGAMPGASYVYVDDTDATYRRALGAGATSLLAPTDTFYG